MCPKTDGGIEVVEAIELHKIVRFNRLTPETTKSR